MNTSAQKLGRMAAGKPKRYSHEELEKRKQRLAFARESRRSTKKMSILLPKSARNCVPVFMIKDGLNISHAQAFLYWFDAICMLDSNERDGFVRGLKKEFIDDDCTKGVADILDKAGCVKFEDGGARLISKTAAKGWKHGW